MTPAFPERRSQAQATWPADVFAGTATCPACREPVSLNQLSEQGDTTCPSCGCACRFAAGVLSPVAPAGQNRADLNAWQQVAEPQIVNLRPDQRNIPKP